MRRLVALACTCVLVVIGIAIRWQGNKSDPPAAKDHAARKFENAVSLRDVTEMTGITFIHSDGSTGEKLIVETVSAGLAILDFDGDGLEDIYFVSGTVLDGIPVPARNGNVLYRNLGGLRFEDVSDLAGVGDKGYGLGVTVGDYNSDGAPDLYVTNFGSNVLYCNNGDGTFVDTTVESGTSAGGGVGAGTCFLDMDADGDLDLYAAKYLAFDVAANLSRTINGVPAYVSPEKYSPLPDVLFRNDGDGTFRDVSIESGIAAYRSWGMGVVAADYDDDGDSDLYVSNDVRESYLFENDGTGHFKEVGLEAGLAYDAFGNAQGSMGVDCGDFNNDGKLDFLQSSFQLQHAILYENQGHGFFEDVAHAAGIAADTFAPVTWGVGLVDFNCDGYRDVFIACGHLQDNVEQYDANATYNARNLLFMNQRDGSFVNQTDRAGGGMQVALSSRGCAFDDLDNDGDIDCVVTNARNKPSILENEGNSNWHWIGLSLIGRRTNRDGVGAQVRVTSETLSQTAEVHSGRSYQSHYGSRLHFGLSERAVVDRIDIRWIGGGVDTFANLPANRRYVVIENQAIVAIEN